MVAGSVKKRTRPRPPLWARISTAAGAVLILASGGVLVAAQVALARIEGVEDAGLIGEPANAGGKSEIKGPLNVLLVGIDPRDDATPPLADSIIVAHIPESMDQAYLFSLPRDLYVDIPASAKSQYAGGKGKINGAMSLGSRVPGGKPDVNQGFQHLAKTVGQVTGIDQFDAGAIVNFGGFKSIVEAMGGVTMTVDQVIKSEHLKPDGKPRARRPECADHSCEHPYIGPQKVYKKGTYHLEAWEALDLVRQRYTLKNGDYDRQRNQQRFIRAITEQALGKDVVTNPAKLLKVLDAAGESLTFSGGGNSVVDWALAMRHVNPKNMVTISLPGSAVRINGRYTGEQFTGPADSFFAAVAEDRVPQYLLDNPGLVNGNN
jgi:anionic cell wall polymer biosynthesis LytR-Cps2A-Psr (LCP) family protein